MRSCGFWPSALAISTIWRRDSGRSRTRSNGLTSSQPTSASNASARRRCARLSIMPKRRGGDKIEILSATERSGISDSSWKMQTMPATAAAAGFGNARKVPSSRNSPASGGTTPAMILIKVDLPAPFSPRTAWILPRPQLKSTLSSARTPPYRLEIPERTRKSAPAAAVMAGPGRTCACRNGSGDKPAQRNAGRLVVRSSDHCVFFSLCDMICGAVNSTPQGVN